MLGWRGSALAHAALGCALALNLSCTFKKVPLAQAGGRDANVPGDTADDTPVGGDANVRTPGGPDAPGGLGRDAVALDAPVPDADPATDLVPEVSPACPAGMRACDDRCIALGLCCRSADCPTRPTGEIATCDASTRTCQYGCPPGLRPCAGQCIAADACCNDDDCRGNFACVANACATTSCRPGYKRCADACIALATCCRADGCCEHADCGPCEKCAVGGACVKQGTREDLKNECGAGTCRTGFCDGSGACGQTADGSNGPGCSDECVRCRAGACMPRTGSCGEGQMCVDGRCPPRPPVVLRTNVNGPAFRDFRADPGAGGVCGPMAFNVPGPINGTEADPLYTGEAYGNPLTCAVGAGQLPPGRYEVTLHFAEIYWGPTCPAAGGGPGARVFDIEIEGRVVARNVDLFAEAGCAAASDGNGRPVQKRFTVQITDGTLDLRFPAHADNGKISAIEIESRF